MTSSQPTPPLQRLMALVTGLRGKTALLREHYLDAKSENDRRQSAATLRQREERGNLLEQRARKLEESRHQARVQRRAIDDARDIDLERFEQQAESIEQTIDHAANRQRDLVEKKVAANEWLAESVYEGKVDHAKRVLREAKHQYGTVEDLVQDLQNLIPRQTGPPPETGKAAIKPAQILEELRALQARYQPPSIAWVRPWAWMAWRLRLRRHAHADQARVTSLERKAAEVLQVIQEQHDAVVGQATRTRDHVVTGVRDKSSPHVEHVEPSRQKYQDRLESKLDEKIEKVRQRYSSQLSRHEIAEEQAVQDLGDEYKRAMSQLDTETREEHEAAESNLLETRGRLTMDWTEAHMGFRRDVEVLTTLRAASPLDWSDQSWRSWEPGTMPETMAVMGEVDFNIKAITDPLEADTPFAWDGPDAATLPLLLSLPNQVSTIIEFEPETRDAALAASRSLILRLLAAVPPGKARLTLLDPIGLGESFAGFMHLADVDEGRVLDQIYSESKHIEEQLLQLTAHMEDVIQRYLRNEYETIDDYNRHAGQIAEPYRFLVMADFPGNLNEQATKRLMSILRSGTRCGVYAILLRDRRRPLPEGLHESDVHEGMIVLRSTGSEWTLRSEGFEEMPVRLGGDMPDDLANAILRKLRDASEATHRVEVPFELIKPSPDQIWTGSTANEIRVALGQHGAKRTQDLRLGRGTAQHALVAGKTGSGKSTLMHVLVTNLALWHAPDEIEFYLVDFKKGVEFQVYDTHCLPHAQVIAIESDREFGLSVLQRIDEELKRRGELFRDLGVQDLAGYRKASGKPLPRVLLVVDEFQELFVEDDMVTQESSLLLDRLVRQGRAFGMHALLGSQTLDGVYSLARSTMGQMGVRIALQCSEADSYLILAEDNPAARLLTRPGDAIYNDAGGKYEGNNPFQIVWLDEQQREASLITLNNRATEAGLQSRPFVFRGHIAATLADCPPLRARLDAPTTGDEAAEAWLGDAVAIKPPTSITLAQRTGANLLLLGQHEEAAAAIIEAVVLALAAQVAAHAKPTFVILDGFGPTNGRLERLTEALPHASQSAHEGDLDDVMAQLHAELGRRLADPRAAHPRLYLVIAAMQSWRSLRRNEDDFSFSADEGPPKPDAILASILRDGPAMGMHVLTWIDTVNNLTRFLDRGSQREFENRVLFQMSQMDSSQVIDSTAAGRLGSNRALLHSEDLGQIEKFRPWGLTDEDWLLQQARRLSS